MPVMAREAFSILASDTSEFYRAMGLKVLLMADSTSRWAQALREMSNRMEELPGPDAFPMDVSADYFLTSIYEAHLNNGSTGSITFIGTVSPAGGNLKEPVTENTKKVAPAALLCALGMWNVPTVTLSGCKLIDSYSGIWSILEPSAYHRTYQRRMDG